ncbi:MAG: hypothetical protein ACI8ZO_000991 [Flavobacteriales bacterium]|jgi:hypothetical protein
MFVTVSTIANVIGEMEGKENRDQEEIFSKILRAGRRTYFFDVRATRAEDYYLTITESKKHTNEDGSFYYKKHKIYLYKEDFVGFNEMLKEATDFIFNEKGTEVISNDSEEVTEKEVIAKSESFTDVDFDDI